MSTSKRILLCCHIYQIDTIFCYLNLSSELQVPSKEQVDALSSDLRARAVVPGYYFLSTVNFFPLGWFTYSRSY